MVSSNSDNVNQWFEQIKSQHRPKDDSSLNHSSETENLLEQFKDNYQKKPPASPEVSVSEDMAKIRAEKQRQLLEETQRKSTSTSGNSDDLFAQFKHQYQGQKSSQPEPSFRETIEEIRVKEQRQQQRQKQLTNQAKQWLEQLSIESDEGFWFEQFAQSYPSRLEAAIAYLDFLENA